MEALNAHRTVRLVGGGGGRAPAVARIGAAACVALGSAVCGIALGKVGGAAGPAWVVALPLGVALAAAVITRPPLGVMAVYGCFPVGFVAVHAGVFDLRLVEAMVIVTTGLVVLRRLAGGLAPLAWAPEMWWALWLLALVVVASPGAINGDLAIKQDVLLAVGILLALTTAAACAGVEDVRRVVGFLMVVGLGLSAYGLRSIAGLRASFGGAVVANRAQGIFAHPNDLGAFAAIVCMVGIGSVFAARTRAGRLGSLVVVVVNVAALLASLSRGAWIGTLLAAVVMLYLLPQARRALIFVGIPLVLVAVVAGAFRSSSPTVVVVRERLSTLSSPTNNPYDDRPSIWREAVREIRADPWTGQGPGNFPEASARSASLSATVGAVHAHDVLLTVAAEAGLPAALVVVCFTLAVGLALRRVARGLPDRADRSLLAGIGCGLVANVGQGLVDFNLRNPVLFLLLWSLVGLVLVGRRELLSARSVEGS